MDIKDKLTTQEKQTIENLRVEMMVLQNVAAEKHNQAGEVLGGILQKLGYNPALYGLEFNAREDKWDVKLRPDALIAPNRELRRHPPN